ncbi:MAG: hypothetical protein ABJP45_16015 [Cyclobacteriaceae bacterium]
MQLNCMLFKRLTISLKESVAHRIFNISYIAFMPSLTKDHLIVKQICISIFAIFLGSQITEGFLLVPFWQSLPAEEFYAYYGKFGPAIGRFYTILTVIAALLPITIATNYLIKRRDGIAYAMVSAIFAVLFILCFYVYFKSANDLFYTSALDEIELSKELVVWNYWHWGRIVLEVVSLVFLILAFDKSVVSKNPSS